MAKLPLINRKSPIKLLDTDLIEVNRRLPDGEIIPLKINIADISYKTKLPEIDFFSEGQSLMEDLRAALKFIPILPSKSTYGPKKHIGGQALWINNSFDVHLDTLDLLKEATADSEREWWLFRGDDLALALALASVWDKYGLDMGNVQEIVTTLIDTVDSTIAEFSEFNTINISSLKKYGENLKEVSAIATEAVDRAKYYVEIITKGPEGEK
jgi:hypothetical protein